MRAGPSSVVPIENHHLQAVRNLQVSRCKRSRGANNLGSQLAAERGAKGPHRQPVTSGAATAPLDSAATKAKSVNRRGGGQSSDWLPIITSNDAVPSPAEPPGALPWREGITDRVLVPSTSNFSSNSAIASARNGAAHPPDDSDNAAYDPPVRIALDVPCASQLGPAADFSTSVSRWLEGGSASLRSWLFQALQGAPSEGFTPLQPYPVQLPSGASDKASVVAGAGDVGDTGAVFIRRTDAAATGLNANADDIRVAQWNGNGGATGADAAAANGKTGIATNKGTDGTTSDITAASAASAVHRMDLLALEPYSEEEALGGDWEGAAGSTNPLLSSGAAAVDWRTTFPDVRTFGAAFGEEREGPGFAVTLEPRPIRRVMASSGAANQSSSREEWSGHHASTTGVGAAAAITSAAMMLTRQLSLAPNWRHVAALLVEHDGQLDLIHVSAALVRLAKLHRENAGALVLPHQQKQRRRQIPLASDGTGRVAGLGDTCGSSSATAAGPGRPQECVSGDERTAVGDVGHPSSEWNAQLHPDVATLVHSLLARLPRLMPRAQHRTVSNILWALGVMQPLFEAPRSGAASGGGQTRSKVAVAAKAPQPSSLSQSAALLAAKMRHFWRDTDLSPQTLALVLWGCARVGLRPGPTWVAEFSATSAPLLSRFTARELSYSFWALATLRLRPDASWLVAARRALVAAVASGTRSAAGGGSQTANPQQQKTRTNMAAAASSAVSGSGASSCHVNAAKEAEGATEDLASGQQAAVNMQTLATMIWACAVLSVRLDVREEEAVVSALTVRLQDEQGAVGAQALCMSLWGCAKMGMRPRRELVTAWRAAASGPVLAAAPARALSCMLWSLARLRQPPPGPWVRECTGALLARAREGTVGHQAACNTLFALASMDSKVSGEWLRGYTAATAPLLASLAPSVLGVVMNSLVRLSGCGSRRDGDGDGGDHELCTADVFLAAADAAAVAALPTASPRDLVGIVCSLQKLSDGTVSRRLYSMFVRRTAHMLRAGLLAPRHAAACLASMAALVHHSRHRRAASSDSEARRADTQTPDAAEPLDHTHTHKRQHGACTTNTAESSDVSRRPLPLPPRSFIGALLRCATHADSAVSQMYDVGTALCAAADLGYVAHGPVAQRAVAAAAVRVCVRTPSAHAVLVLLRGLCAVRVTPSTAWLSDISWRVGSAVRKLTGPEVEELVRLLWVLGCAAADKEQVAERGPEAAASAGCGAAAVPKTAEDFYTASSSGHHGTTIMANAHTATAALSELHWANGAGGPGTFSASSSSPGAAGAAAAAATSGGPRVGVMDEAASDRLHLLTDPPHSPVSALLLAAQAGLAASPIQSLLSLAAGLVAASSGSAGAQVAPGQSISGSSSPSAGWEDPVAAGDVQEAAGPLPQRCSSLPLPAVPLSTLLPPDWLQSLEAATAPKLGLPCVSAATLVELLACFACLGHRPSAAWAASWYDSTAGRLATLRPMHLCMALQLQGRLGMKPPRAWMAAYATTLAAAAAARVLPPLDVLAAVAELQRLGYDTDMGHAAEQQLGHVAYDRSEKAVRDFMVTPKAQSPDIATGKGKAATESVIANGIPSWPTSGVASTGASAAVYDANAVTSLSGLVVVASNQLHQQLLAAKPAAQLATLAALQALTDPRVTSAPQSEGWVVGVLAMAHSVILQRPLHELLAALHLTASPSSLAVMAEIDASSATDEPPADTLSLGPSTSPPSSSSPLSAPVSTHDATRPSPSSSMVLLLASLARWYQAPSSRWLSCLARHISGHTDSPNTCWSAADTARAVCCLAALRYVPAADVAVRLQQRQLTALAAGELRPALAAELCAAWAAVRRPPSAAWWRAVESASLAPTTLATLMPTTLIRLPVSMARLGHVPSYEWLVAYLALVPPALLGQPTSAGLTPVVHADDLANLAWALGSAVHEGGYTHDLLSSSGALQALLTSALPVLGSMGPGQLVMLVEGLARCRHELPQEWVVAFAGQVARQLPACGPPELVSVLYCLAFLQARPPLPWLAATLHRTAQLLPALLISEQAYRVTDLMWAVTQLDPSGDMSMPFLELVARQRAAVVAATPLPSYAHGHYVSMGRRRDQDEEPPPPVGTSRGRGTRRGPGSGRGRSSPGGAGGGDSSSGSVGLALAPEVEEAAGRDVTLASPAGASGEGQQVLRGRRVGLIRGGRLRLSFPRPQYEAAADAEVLPASQPAQRRRRGLRVS